MSFYRVGTEYPVGRIITSGGRRLVIHTGAQVITSVARAVVDGMWDGDLHIPDEATLDIVPALRQVTVDVKNKSLPNLIDYLGGVEQISCLSIFSWACTLSPKTKLLREAFSPAGPK